MGRVYAVPWSGQAIAEARDLFDFTPASDRPVKIHAIFVSQNSDVGDAAEELLLVQIKRNTTGGSGGGTVTPVALHEGDAASGITSVEVYNNTQATGGTVIHAEYFNIRTGLQLIFTPDMMPHFEGSTQGTISLSAPGDSLTMSGTLYYEEII